MKKKRARAFVSAAAAVLIALMIPLNALVMRSAFAASASSSQSATGGSFSDISVSGRTVTVSYYAPSGCRVLAAVYTTDGYTMLGSAIQDASAGSHTDSITVALDEVPESGVVKAFMLDKNTFYPASDSIVRSFSGNYQGPDNPDEPDDPEEPGSVTESGSCGTGVTYKLYENGLLEISGSGTMDDYSDIQKVYPPWNDSRSLVRRVRIDSGVKSIGKEAFQFCYNMTEISIADSVTSIGSNAFAYCSGLTELDIPSSVKEIKYSTFFSCRGMTKVTIPSSVTKIGDYAFANCESLTGITIPSSVTQMGGDVFEGCTSLTRVTIPSSVTRISASTFYGCTSLTGVTLPSTLTEIGYSAFAECTSLTGLTIPQSVTKIDMEAFYGCTSLISLNLPGGLTVIQSDLFHGCTALRSVYIPQSVTKVAMYAFDGCDALTTVYYGGSQSGWSSVWVETGNDALTSARKYYNSAAPSSSPSPKSGSAYTTGANFDGLVPGERYLFVISRASAPSTFLNPENLIFADQKTAGQDGRLTFQFDMESHSDAVLCDVFGPRMASVTLDNAFLTLHKGESFSLDADVDRDHSLSDVTWTSSDTRIVTVSSQGVIKAVGIGEATVTASVDGASYECVVTVMPTLDFTILGASIRMSEPYGIRFGIQLGKGSDYSSTQIVEYGTLMKPTSELGDDELLLDTPKIRRIEGKTVYSETSSALVYTGVLINIPTTYFNATISGRGYLIYQDLNGEQHTIYTDVVEMSFIDVVDAAYRKYSAISNPNESQRAILEKLETLMALGGR